MTEANFLITPPDELVQHWESIAYAAAPVPYTHHIARCAARWGWDQRGAANQAELQEARDEELEACCEWLSNRSSLTEKLRAARRPKPPSLKERIATAITHGDNSIALALLDQALPD